MNKLRLHSKYQYCSRVSLINVNYSAEEEWLIGSDILYSYDRTAKWNKLVEKELQSSYVLKETKHHHGSC